MAAGTSTVKELRQIAHSPTPTKSAQAAPTTRRRAAIPPSADRGGRREAVLGAHHGGHAPEPAAFAYITTCLPHLLISQKSSPGESEAQVRTRFYRAHGRESDAAGNTSLPPDAAVRSGLEPVTTDITATAL